MLFDDSRESIIRNLYKYAENGGTPYCTQFDYVPEFERFIAPDKKELEYSYAMNGKRCVVAFYDDNVDRKLSGLTRRVHNGNLLNLIGKKIGNKAKDFIRNVGVKDIKTSQKILYGTTYSPLIRKMGKGTAGLCLWGNNDCLVLYTSNVSSLHSIMSFYHEMGHAMSYKLGLTKQNDEVLNLLKRRISTVSEQNKSAARRVYMNEKEYGIYLSESSAEIFGTMMTLLRTKTEREFQTAAGALLEHAAKRMFHGGGSKSFSAYNAYGAVKQVIQLFNGMGRRERAEFGKENGRFSLDKVAKMADTLAKNSAMSREEYKNYYSTAPERLNRHIGERGYGWIQDYWEASNIVFQNQSKNKLDEMVIKLNNAKSRRQIYDAFHDYANQVPEAMDIYNIYCRNSVRAMAYDKLRKTQEILGVDNLFGAFAQKRRELGSNIMLRINCGRD